jgi:hypothetical protein
MTAERIALSSLLLLAGCPGGSEPEPPTPAPEPAVGVDPSVPAGPGEVRGGVLPEDPAAFAASAWGGIAAEARPGDPVLYNDRVRFAVRRAAGHGYVGVAGALIDADIVRPEGQLGRDTLEEAFLAFGIGRLAGADTVELIADGSDGGPAVVRVTGTDVPWVFVQGVTGSDEPIGPALGLSIVTDYVLEADAQAVLIRTTLTNTGSEMVRVNPLDGLIAAQEDLASYGSDEGLAPGDLEQPPAIGVVGRHGEASLLLYRDDGPLDRFAAADLLASSGIELLAHGWRDIEPGATEVLERFRAVGKDPATVEAARYRAQGVTTAPLTGQVTSDGGPVAGARVHLLDAAVDPPRFLGFAVTDAVGAWAMEVPPGDYTAVVTGTGPDEYVDLPAAAGRYAPFTQPSVNARQLAALTGESTPVPLVMAVGHGEAAPVAISVPAGGATLDLTLPSAGSLQVTVTSGGLPLPAYVEIRRAGGAPDSPIDDGWRAALGLPARTPLTMRAWSGDGAFTVALPPDTYDVLAFGSHRHARGAAAGIVVDDESGSVAVDLEQVVSKGDSYLAMDSHLHAAPSTDGSLPMEDRLIVCAAAGVEIPVTTDHDRMTSYGPLVPALGLSDSIHPIDGVEVSPVLRGHFNLFPATGSGPSVPNGGAPAWWEPTADTDALMQRIRDVAPDAVIQVNHGRESPSGMMSAGVYEPTTGEAFRPDYWSWDFDLVEIVNARGPRAWLEPRADWFSWLSLGQRRVPVGVSDSHGRTSGCGYGRTDVRIGVDTATEVTPAALREALAAGHAIVSGGITMRVEDAGGALPGDVTVGAGVDLAITVAGPDWAVPDTVRVYRNGTVIMEEAIAGPPTDGVWWSGSVQDSPGEDAWYVVESEGSQALGGPYGGALPYALANAVFLDRDGDGWDPPGLPGN